ncbi:MAG: CapA family protein [Candidatus Binataceae bacterium]|jgi:poly-gamma-glutamate synthesis protein (capsule biosynthesis protein)
MTPERSGPASIPSSGEQAQVNADLRLLLVGDVMIGRVVNEMLRSGPPGYLWGDTKHLFRESDWRACNLECVISDIGSPWNATPKVFHFRSNAKNITVLKEAGIDAVSLANNHTLDFGYAAMGQMLELLDRAGIRHAGAGPNLDASTRPAICDVKGAKIGLVAFTDNQPEWEADANCPGVFYLPIDADDERARRLLETVREAKRAVDILVVSAHWGPNWGYKPLAAHVKFGRLVVDAGADVVFGHSAHVFHGIELYKGRPILYSTGNFVDDYAVDETERNDESFVFTLDFVANRFFRLRLYPTVIADCQVQLASGDRAKRIASKMARLCTAFGTPAQWNGQEQVLEIKIR